MTGEILAVTEHLVSNTLAKVVSVVIGYARVSQTIEYTDAVFDETTNTWVSKAEVAETVFTAFSSRKKDEQITGRLVVRRIPELNPKAGGGQDTLFVTYRYHAFFTTVDAAVLDTVAADQTHRKHALIEQVNADLKDSALAHMPSGVIAANSAWLVAAVMAYNFARAAGLLAAGPFGKARTDTIRRKLINVPPASPPAPENTPSLSQSLALANTMAGPVRDSLPAAATCLNPVNPATWRKQNHQWNTNGQQGPAPKHALSPQNRQNPDSDHQPTPIGGSRLRRIRAARRWQPHTES